MGGSWKDKHREVKVQRDGEEVAFNVYPLSARVSEEARYLVPMPIPPMAGEGEQRQPDTRDPQYQRDQERATFRRLLYMVAQMLRDQAEGNTLDERAEWVADEFTEEEMGMILAAGTRGRSLRP